MPIFPWKFMFFAKIYSEIFLNWRCFLNTISDSLETFVKQECALVFREYEIIRV